MIRFSNLEKKIFQITILNLEFEIPAHNSKNLFKFQAQDSDLEYFFWDLEIWKTNLTFWKEATFSDLKQFANSRL